MSNFTETKSDFDLSNVLLFFIKWWKLLAVLLTIAAVAGAVFSSPTFITPKYQATVVMFPAPVLTLSAAVFVNNYEYFRYGGLTDAENLLQVLGSDAIRERVAARFNLYEHYEIPHDSPYRETELRLQFGGNVSAERTQFGAVRVTVRDKDPVMAADIANFISYVVDTVKNELREERALLAHQVALERYENIRREIETTEDSLRTIMQRGVYHYESQSERLTQQLAIDISENNQHGIRELEERISAIKNYGARFMIQETHLNHISHFLADAQRLVHNTRMDIDKFYKYTYLLDEAVVPEKDAYPVRWLIVFFSTFAAGLMGVISLMAYEIFVKKGLIKQKTK